MELKVMPYANPRAFGSITESRERAGSGPSARVHLEHGGVSRHGYVEALKPHYRLILVIPRRSPAPISCSRPSWRFCGPPHRATMPPRGRIAALGLTFRPSLLLPADQLIAHPMPHHPPDGSLW